MAKHALLSASSSARWLNCPPSLLLNKKVEDEEKGSIFAQEGTLAHELGEYKAIKEFSCNADLPDLEAIKAHELYDDDMEYYTDRYLDYLKDIVYGMSPEPSVLVEQRVSYDKYAKDGFGTADFIAVGDGVLHVCDLKYGRGIEVSAVDNPQLKLYALGVVDMYKPVYNIKKVVMHIIQPRLNNYSSSEVSVGELLDFGDLVKYKSKLALKGEGNFCAGDHCRFCKVRATCRERAEANLRLAGFAKEQPHLLSNDEVAECLSIAKDLTAWAKDLESYALNELLNGGDVKGYKVVEGRSRRVINDTKGFAEYLKHCDYKEDEIYKPKELLGITALEKIIGRKKFTELSDGYIDKPAGKPTLVTLDDKRQAINKNIEEIFKEEN